jgi:hypothetical protein
MCPPSASRKLVSPSAFISAMVLKFCTAVPKGNTTLTPVVFSTILVLLITPS